MTFRDIYIYMHEITMKKETINLKENGKKDIKRFGERKGKG